MPDTIEAPPIIDPGVKDLLKNLANLKPEDAEKEETKEPALWAIILHNDNTTFPDFVTKVLMEAFSVEGMKARNVMMTAHRSGQCVVKVVTKDQAETQHGVAMVMVRNARAGRDFYGGIQKCELQFTLREETKEG